VHVEAQTVPRSGAPPGPIVGAVGLLAAALAAGWFAIGLPRPVCYFREFTGIPCLTCGSTRLVESVLRGDVVAALTWNPLVFFVLLGVGVWVVVSTARWLTGRPQLRVALARNEQRVLRAAAGVAIAAGWAYLIWRAA